MINYVFTKNEYEFCKNIKWEDVITKIDSDCSNFEYKSVCDEYSIPTLNLRSNFYPESIQKAYNEVKHKTDIKVLHVYTSFGKNALTFGRHCDRSDVLLVQAIGKMLYAFDDGELINLSPGDSLFVPKGVYHDPITLEPRVTLSFSWE